MGLLNRVHVKMREQSFPVLTLGPGASSHTDTIDPTIWNLNLEQNLILILFFKEVKTCQSNLNIQTIWRSESQTAFHKEEEYQTHSVDWQPTDRRLLLLRYSVIKSSRRHPHERHLMTDEQRKLVYCGRARHAKQHKDKVHKFVVAEPDRLVSVIQCTKQQGNHLNFYANWEKHQIQSFSRSVWSKSFYGPMWQGWLLAF